MNAKVQCNLIYGLNIVKSKELDYVQILYYVLYCCALQIYIFIHSNLCITTAFKWRREYFSTFYTRLNFDVHQTFRLKRPIAFGFLTFLNQQIYKLFHFWAMINWTTQTFTKIINNHIFKRFLFSFLQISAVGMVAHTFRNVETCYTGLDRGAKSSMNYYSFPFSGREFFPSAYKSV